MSTEFEWDRNKARTNFQKHKVSFEEGTTIFNDWFVATMFDPDHSIVELRKVGIGLSAKIASWCLHTPNVEKENALLAVEKQLQLSAESMKKATTKSRKLADDEMRPEYDFRGAVRGKDYRPLEKGYTIYIHQPDGTTVVKHMKLEKGMVRLHPDVQEYFPDTQAVDRALRSLIALIPKRTENPKRGMKNGQRSSQKTRTQARIKSKSTNSR